MSLAHVEQDLFYLFYTDVNMTGSEFSEKLFQRGENLIWKISDLKCVSVIESVSFVWKIPT